MTASTTQPEATTAPTAEDKEKAIRQVVQKYFVGLRDGDVGSLGEAFDDLAVVCGYIGTELYVKHVKTLYDFVVESPRPSQDFRCDVTAIAIAGSTAVVTLAEHDYLGVDYTTSLHLLVAEEGKWAIVSKLFDGVPRPVS